MQSVTVDIALGTRGRTRIVDAAIVGAGPYGLSIAAHLKCRGVNFRIFGKPMATWLRHMPKGMLLKSDGFASSLSAPAPDHTLRSFCGRNRIAYDDYSIPVALATFTDYALDFQRRFVPELDQRDVTALASADGAFIVRLDGGESIVARRVVLAVGISHFGYVPDVLCRDGRAFVTHSSAHRNLEGFQDKDITVVGAGASAIDLAAELHESGANVRLVARRQDIHFSSPPKPAGSNLWQKIRHPSSGLGPGFRSRLYCELPHLFRYLPAPLRLLVVRRHLGPSSPWHLRPRVMGKVTVMTGHEVESAVIRNDRLWLGLRNGHSKPVPVATDHVIAATGYRVDLQRLRFIDKGLLDRVRTAGAMPMLSTDFEASVPGLYFTGLAAAGSFGPLMRFMYGTEFAARRISQHIAASRQST
jgi:thioredoxin reductase